MTFDTEQVEAITFDSFTTIVDVTSTTKRALSEYVDDPTTVNDIASLWRFRAVEYRMVSNAVGPYETYYSTTRDALEYALAVNDINLSKDDIENITSNFYELDVYDDVTENIRRLDGMGYDLYIVSNGTQDLLESMVTRAGITDFIEETISADEVEIYKPEIEFYQHALERIGTTARNTVHIATPWYDIYGANNAEMQTIWVNRDKKPWEKFEGKPNKTVPGMNALPSLF